MSRYDYLLVKIVDAPFCNEPFSHVHIDSFLRADDFEEIVQAPEIALPAAHDDHELFDILGAHGYKTVEFPGCITDRARYIAFRESGDARSDVRTSCEGFGMTFRLYDAVTPAIRELIDFLSSERFNRTLAAKFNIDLDDCNVDNGIQKYLDGYEISPHPDVRRKAATFMVNINPHAKSEELDHHTHYLRFKPERKSVQDYWERNSDTDRCWVPWDWCDDVKTQPQNNSIVLFSPSNASMHAVRAHYDHLPAQRTQLYGNLWYSHTPRLKRREWEDFAMDAGEISWRGVMGRAMSMVPSPINNAVQRGVRTVRALGKSDAEVGVRRY